MKTHPCELKFIQITDEEFARVIVNSGWIECITYCPIDICEEGFPHRHYICKCGSIDFSNRERCFGCWHMKKLHDIGLDLIEFKKECGRTMIRLGFAVAVFITFTMANMGVR